MRIGKEAEDSTWDDPTSDDSTSEAVGAGVAVGVGVGEGEESPANSSSIHVRTSGHATLVAKRWPLCRQPCSAGVFFRVVPLFGGHHSHGSWDGCSWCTQWLCKNVYISSRKCGIPIAILDWSAWFWCKFLCCKKDPTKTGCNICSPMLEPWPGRRAKLCGT